MRDRESLEQRATFLEHSHFAERFQLFVIIALGESVVTTGGTAAGLDLDGGRGLALVVAFVLGAALWWLYFDEVAGRSAEDFAAAGGARGQLGRDAYTYLHVPIVAGIILAAAGADAIIGDPHARLANAHLAVLAAGPILYLLGHVTFRMRMIGTASAKRLLAAAAIAVAAHAFGLTGADVPAVVPGAVISAMLAGLAVIETIGRLSRGTRRPGGCEGRAPLVDQRRSR